MLLACAECDLRYKNVACVINEAVANIERDMSIGDAIKGPGARGVV